MRDRLVRFVDYNGLVAPQVQQLIYEDVPNVEKWVHELRDQWRAELLRRASKNRPKHYHDVESMCMRRTLMVYRLWGKKALRTGDEESIMKVGVLRLLLTGGLMTGERDARHRKDKNPVLCACGKEPTVLHISWECEIYKAIRQPIVDPPFFELPTCTKYGAIITEQTPLTDAQIIALQTCLVDIWQAYIRDFKTGQRSELPTAKPKQEDSSFDQNGHVLKPRTNNKPGVFCCKCGKFVARSKHIRFKITSKPCPQKDSTMCRMCILLQKWFLHV